MLYKRIVNNNFQFAHHQWSVRTLGQVLKQDHHLRWIIRYPFGKGWYHLFSRERLMALIQGAARDQKLEQAIPKKDWPATAFREIHEEVEEDLKQVILLQDQRLVGFYDEALEVRPITRTGEQAHPKGAAPLEQTLCTNFPESIRSGQEAVLEVFMEESAPSRESFALETGSIINVIVFSKRGFKFLGPSSGTIETPSSGGLAETLRFRVQAIEEGPGCLQVMAVHQMQAVGSFDINCRIVPEEPVPRNLGEQHWLFTNAGLQPDLTLMILENNSEKAPTVCIIPYTNNPDLDLSGERQMTSLNMDMPHQFFNSFFDTMEQIVIEEDPSSWEAARQRLTTRGISMFQQLFPLSLQSQIWRQRERIRSVFIQSDTPIIPWEICKLSDPFSGQTGPFFAEGFAITRWLPKHQPKLELSLKQTAVVYADQKDRGVKLEQRAMKELTEEGKMVEPVKATYANIVTRLKSEEYDAWHFSGHATHNADNPDWARFYLNRDEFICPEDLIPIHFRRKAPMIFMNACQTGRSGPSLSEMGGWVPRFLAAGAGSVIATYWKVQSTIAARFARKYYSLLLAGIPMMEAFRQARLEVRSKTGNPSWLAFVLFADPRAQVDPGVKPMGLERKVDELP